MIVRNWITEEAIKAALNVVPPSASSYARFLEKLLAATPAGLTDQDLAVVWDWVASAKRTIRTREAAFLRNYLSMAPSLVSSSVQSEGWTLPETISRRESMPVREALTSAHLRRYVDAWLETGRQPDGSESPSRRDLREARDAFVALHDYIGKAPVTLSLSLDHATNLTALVANPTAYSGGVRNFFEAQIVESQRLFLGIMASDWTDRLCKCRYQYCGRYFLHPKPRACYRRGIFCCRQHAASAAADESMRRARKTGREKLIELAAHKLCVWRVENRAWQDDADVKRRLASSLCLEIPRRRLQRYQQEVTVTWVSRHQEWIERRRLEMNPGGPVIQP